MNKKKKKVRIIKVERTSIDSPLPIYKVDIETNIIVTKPRPRPSNYLREVVNKDKKVISLYYFELLENLLIPMNVTFIIIEGYNMPYGIRGNAHKVYKKLEMKKYINSNSFENQLEDIFKEYQENENIPDINLKSGMTKRYGKMELFSPREIEIYLK